MINNKNKINQNNKNRLRLVVSFLCSFAIVSFIWISLPSSVYADIAVSGSVSSGSAGSGTQLTISHTTPSGSDRLMVVGIGANPHTTGFYVTSVTYNGVSLSGLTPSILSDDAFSQLFYLKAPDVGTYNVVIKWNNALDSTGELMAAVMTFTGVDQTTPVGTRAGATGTSGTAGVSGISSATGEWIVDAVACETCTSFTAGGGQTERWKLSNNNDWGAGSTKPGAASVSMSWTLGSSDHWAIMAVPIKPASVTSPANTPTPTPTSSCVTGYPVWQNSSFTSQTGTFTAEFDVTPTSNQVDQAVVGLSNGPASSASDMTANIRFGSGGVIKAYNGSTSSYDGSINYAANVKYNIRMEVNVATDTYSVYVTPQGQTQQTLVSGVAFRNPTTQLNNRAIQQASVSSGYIYVCGFTIGGTTATPTPTPAVATPTPTPVTYTLYAVDSLRRRIIDPCNRVDKPSQDLTAQGGTYSLGGYTFNYRSEPIPVSETLVLMVRSLFASTRFGLERLGGGDLPVQGKYVTSEAKSPTGVTKKIQLFQSFPQIPAEFFVTSF